MKRLALIKRILHSVLLNIEFRTNYLLVPDNRYSVLHYKGASDLPNYFLITARFKAD